MPAVTFGPFRLDLQTGELHRSGVCIKLQPQPAKLLVLLVERAGALVTRDEIRRAVWDAETFVDFDQSVNFCVRQIRTVLHDNADTPCYIETLPRRGYRFIAPVRQATDEAGEAEAVTTTVSIQLRPPIPRFAVAAAIVAMAGVVVGIALVRHAPSIAARAPSVRADEQVQLGRYFLKKVSRADTERAVELLEAATRENPEYAPAFAGLADAYNQLGNNFVAARPPSEYRLRAIRAAKRAIQLDPTLAEPHAAVGYASLREIDWAEADRSLRRAIELNPRYAVPRQLYASYLVAQRRFAEAIAEARRAVELEPTSLAARHTLGWMLYFDRQYDAAISELRTILQMDRTYAMARWRLGQVQLMAGRTDEAVATLLAAAEDTRRAPSVLGLLAMAYGRRDQRGEARKILQELEARSANQPTPIGPLVMSSIGVADHARAIERLEQVYAERDGFAIYMDVDPLMDALRDQPRYQALCRRVMFGAKSARGRPM